MKSVILHTSWYYKIMKLHSTFAMLLFMIENKEHLWSSKLQRIYNFGQRGIVEEVLFIDLLMMEKP